MSKPALLVTAADLAPQALELLQDFDVVYAGKTPQVADLVALARGTTRSRSSCATARSRPR